MKERKESNVIGERLFLVDHYNDGRNLPFGIRCAFLRLFILVVRFMSQGKGRMLSWLQSPALQSVLIDPRWTIRHVREAQAIRRLNPAAKQQVAFVLAYQGFRIRLPPLLLAVLEWILGLVPERILGSPPGFVAEFLWGLFALAIDVRISRTLFYLGTAIMEQCALDDRINHLQRIMPEKIKAELLHVFSVTPTVKSRQDLHEEKQIDMTSGGKSQIPEDSIHIRPMFTMEDLPSLVSQIYFCSPISILVSSTTDCFQSIMILLLMEGLLEACCCRGKTDRSVIRSALLLSVAAYMDLHCVVFFIPAALWLIQGSNDRTLYSFPLYGFVFSTLLQGLAYLLIGDLGTYTKIAALTHGDTFRITGLAPSLSMLWYLGMELFERFIVYFTVLIGAVPYILIAPIAIRLFPYPNTLVSIYWMLGTLFRPPGTLYSLNIALCFMLLCPHSLARMQSTLSLISLCALPVPVLLYIVDYWMWLETNTGEANYLYFQCLAYHVFVSFLFLRFCAASLQHDKALRLTEKGTKNAQDRSSQDCSS